VTRRFQTSFQNPFLAGGPRRRGVLRIGKDGAGCADDAELRRQHDRRVAIVADPDAVDHALVDVDRGEEAATAALRILHQQRLGIGRLKARGDLPGLVAVIAAEPAAGIMDRAEAVCRAAQILDGAGLEAEPRPPGLAHHPFERNVG
jgi:hypothetical protein